MYRYKKASNKVTDIKYSVILHKPLEKIKVHKRLILSIIGLQI